MAVKWGCQLGLSVMGLSVRVVCALFISSYIYIYMHNIYLSQSYSYVGLSIVHINLHEWNYWPKEILVIIMVVVFIPFTPSLRILTTKTNLEIVSILVIYPFFSSLKWKCRVINKTDWKQLSMRFIWFFFSKMISIYTSIYLLLYLVGNSYSN